MPTEPNKNIEHLLKAYAAKRREAAREPLEMHSATRHFLQSEIARLVPRKQGREDGWLKLLPRFWPRLALGASLLALVAVICLVWLQSNQSSFELAKNTEITSSSPTPPQANSDRLTLERATPESPAEVRLLNSEVTDGGVQSRGVSNQPPLSRPDDPAAQQPATVGRIARESMALDSGANAPTTTTLVTAASPVSRDRFVQVTTNAPVPDGLAMPTLARANSQDASTLTEANAANSTFFKTQAPGLPGADSNSLGLHFSQENSRANYRQNFNSPPYPNILTSFQVHQRGNNLSIVDADGSIYEGTIETVPQESRSRSVGTKSVAQQPELVKLKRGPGQSQNEKLTRTVDSSFGVEKNVSFRAAGTNRSLNQKVVFTGNILPGGNPFPQTMGRAAGRNDSAPPVLASGSPGSNQPTQRSRKVPTSPRGATAGNAGSPPQLPSAEVQALPWGRIEGKASVGGNNEYKIEAVRVQP